MKRGFTHQKLVNMFRKPFRRKSVPSSPVAPPRTKGRRDSAPRSEGGDPVGGASLTVTNFSFLY